MRIRFISVGNKKPLIVVASILYLMAIISGSSSLGSPVAPARTKLVKAVPSEECVPIGVMYGRGKNQKAAIADLLINTKEIGGTHAIVTEEQKVNEGDFDLDTVFMALRDVLVYGEGYHCSIA